MHRGDAAAIGQLDIHGGPGVEREIEQPQKRAIPGILAERQGIRAAADEAGVAVQTTEMWDKWDLSHRQHDNTFDHPEVYSFVDISQNNHNQGQVHWDNAQKQLARICESGRVRPLNCVKVYGADTGRFGNTRDAQERFWRNIFGGLAGTRFHRPNSGLGLSKEAQANIKAMRMFTDELNVFTCLPANDLLARSSRSKNEAYCMADPPRAYGVYFTDGGQVLLDISASGGKPMTVRWLDIMAGKWSNPLPLPAQDGQAKLTTPSAGYWAALIKIER